MKGIILPTVQFGLFIISSFAFSSVFLLEKMQSMQSEYLKHFQTEILQREDRVRSLLNSTNGSQFCNPNGCLISKSNNDLFNFEWLKDAKDIPCFYDPRRKTEFSGTIVNSNSCYSAYLDAEKNLISGNLEGHSLHFSARQNMTVYIDGYLSGSISISEKHSVTIIAAGEIDLDTLRSESPAISIYSLSGGIRINVIEGASLVNLSSAKNKEIIAPQLYYDHINLEDAGLSSILLSYNL